MAALGPPPPRTDMLLDVRVEQGRVPEPWNAPVQWRGVLWADERSALLRIGGLAVWVQDGQQVVVETASEQERRDRDFVLYSGALRLLLTQRRRFTLHATVVVTPDGQPVAVAGDSMAGKSTTVAALMQHGWAFACDDVVEIRQPGSVAVPHERPIHLSDAAARMLGGDPAVGRELPGRSKRAYHLPADLTPRPLAAVVHLTADAALDGDQPALQWLDPVAALIQLVAIGERTGLTELPALRADHLDWIAGLVSAVPVVAVRRPGGRNTVTTMAELVREVVAEARPVG